MLQHRIPALVCAQHCIVFDLVVFFVSFFLRFLVLFVFRFVAPPTRMVGRRHWGRMQFFLRMLDVVVVVALVVELDVRGVDKDELGGALFESWSVKVDCCARFRLMPFILFTISVGIM